MVSTPSAKTAKPEPIIELLPDRQPWEYHPWETPQAFASLQVYLRLGHTRSIAKVHYELMPEAKRQAIQEAHSITRSLNTVNSPSTDPGKSDDKPTTIKQRKAGRPQAIPGGSQAIATTIPKTLFEYRARYLWSQRAQSWDNHLAKIELQAIIDQRTQLAKNCVSYGDKMSAVGIRTIDHMLKKKAQVSVEQAIKLVEAGTKLSRTGLGIDDETAAKINHQTNNVQINLSNLSAEELAALRELRRKVMAPNNQAATQQSSRLQLG